MASTESMYNLSSIDKVASTDPHTQSRELLYFCGHGYRVQLTSLP